MNEREQRTNAKRFAADWLPKNLGREKQDTHSFWLSLLADVFGVEGAFRRFIDFEKKVKLSGGHVGFIDGFIHDTKVLIEQKGRGISLTEKAQQSDGSMLTPYEQAQRYAAALNLDEQPRWIVTCNFDEFRIYDQNDKEAEPSIVTLENFENEFRRLSVLTDRDADAIPHEVQLSVEAGRLVGKLYKALRAQYSDKTPEAEIDRSLNVLCVRLAFCLYAEDSGLFGKHAMFHDYLRSFPVETAREGLKSLFKVLDTDIEHRDPYMSEALAAFPYVNGGLFKDDPERPIVIPRITPEILDILLSEASEGFDWKNISPTIFGAVFESTLNKETQRKGGMHYTSIENIHKVIDPLFLDALRAEYKHILGYQVEGTRNKALRKFQEKLGSLFFLDPACGSGNFLTETYLSLRRLENDLLRVMTHGQQFLGHGLSPIQVHINQFYGIEINDFAVTVARTALWIAEHQMMQETEDVMQTDMEFLPLKSYSNIVEGNALRMDWTGIAPKAGFDYIMGNPPFLGYSNQSKEQKADMLSLFTDEAGKPYQGAGKIDYVAGWYFKASQMMFAPPHAGKSLRGAFVSTNSITQGEQVALVWKPLFERFGIHFDFAYRSFVWDSEAAEKAHVHCVIIGFSTDSASNLKKRIFDADKVTEAANINPYLVDAQNAFIEARRKPLESVSEMTRGSQPTDDGNLILTVEEKEALLAVEPQAAPFIRPFMMGKDFIDRKPRFCLWMVGANPSLVKKCPQVQKRIDAVREFRLASKKPATRKKAETPSLFDEVRNSPTNYLAVPKVSSENRRYIPIDYLSQEIIAGDKLFWVPDATHYLFGVLTSSVHMAWMRAVAGRLEMRYSYSNTVVYNNFVWPEATDKQREKIAETAKAILDVRAKYPDSSLADLYDESTMPVDLRKAHKANDKAVMAAYGFKANASEAEIVAELFKRYEQRIKKLEEESEDSAPKKTAKKK